MAEPSDNPCSSEDDEYSDPLEVAASAGAGLSSPEKASISRKRKVQTNLVLHGLKTGNAQNYAGISDRPQVSPGRKLKFFPRNLLYHIKCFSESSFSPVERKRMSYIQNQLEVSLTSISVFILLVLTNRSREKSKRPG